MDIEALARSASAGARKSMYLYLNITFVVREPISMFDSHSLDEIDKTYQSIADLGVKLKAVREENSRHGQVVYHAVSVCFTVRHLTLNFFLLMHTVG